MRTTVKRKEDPRPAWFLRYLKMNTDCDSMPDPNVVEEDEV